MAIRRAFIPAAGLGTRLRPLTDTLPKPMVPIGGRPLLERLIRLLVRCGVTDMAVNLHYLPETVLSHFGDGAAFGARLRFAVEEELLGSAGAVNNFRDFFEEPFFVVYGDVFTTMDLAAMASFHEQQGGAATVGLYRVDNPTECGLADMDANGRIRRFVEKPRVAFTDLANAGVYAMTPKVLDYIPTSGFCDFGHDVFPAMLENGEAVYGLPIDAYLIDIGSREKYDKANRDFPTLGVE